MKFSILVAGMFLFVAIPAISGENQALHEDALPSEIEDIEANEEKLNLEDVSELSEKESLENEENFDDKELDTQQIEQEIEMLLADNKKTDKEIEDINKLLENQEKEVAAQEQSINKEISQENVDESNLQPEQVMKGNDVSDKSHINPQTEQDAEKPEEK